MVNFLGHNNIFKMIFQFQWESPSDRIQGHFFLVAQAMNRSGCRFLSVKLDSFKIECEVILQAEDGKLEVS